ncbi:hypothetical protein [Dyadobacter bucti]|uniref:hypothetical protein n=1 Tax=Dyadobacter bucti TaxID=2572203 RepID=UPI003F71212F
MHGLLISEKGVRVIDFLPDNRHSNATMQLPTARQSQDAVREGTLTAENVEAEIKRVQAKQERSLELDQEKVQLAMHAAFFERFGVPEANSPITKADEVAIRLIVFQTLDYQLRYQVSEALGLSGDALSRERYFETLAGLSQTQFAYMLRMAVAGNAESKRPQSINGWSLRAVAAEGGLDVETIEQTQQKVAHSRGEKVGKGFWICKLANSSCPPPTGRIWSIIRNRGTGSLNPRRARGFLFFAHGRKEKKQKKRPGRVDRIARTDFFAVMLGHHVVFRSLKDSNINPCHNMQINCKTVEAWRQVKSFR